MINEPFLYGPNGQVLASKKTLTGEIVTSWNGDRSLSAFSRLPTQLNLGFDTSKLTIADYRLMREHHQVASSLSVLSFMMYQREWHLEAETAKVEKHCTENLTELWPRLVRAMSQAFWAGYSPCVLQFENDVPGHPGKTWITKIKDLRPEECTVRWTDVPGVAEKRPGVATIKHKIPIFDGITQFGYPDIPVSNSFWYPLLMENGDYYGRKLLNAAFRPWYFSMIMHVYANRYMERFAEPTPIGRAPYDDVVKIGNTEYSGPRLMAHLMEMQRSGTSFILPNARTTDALNGDSTYDYTLEYIESQLRGVEFDRIIQMYDEEISLALFTPLLLMRNTDIGSSNLGVVHTQTYLQTLNAIGGDWEEYIDRYLLTPMVRENFGSRARPPHIKFRPLGRTDNETLRALLQGLMDKGTLGVDLEELGAAAGLTLKEVKAVLPDPATQAAPALATPDDKRVGRPGKNTAPTGVDKVKKVAEKISLRLNEQATKHYRAGAVGNFEPDLGHRKQFTDTLIDIGISEYDASGMYSDVQRKATLAAADFTSPDEYCKLVEGLIVSMVGEGIGETQDA